MTAPGDSVASPSEAEIRAALDRVVASLCFRGSPRLASFLCFVVEAKLAGQADRLKGYSIAIGALGRSDTFDPQTNPIVRVEAGRLRRALERYYAGSGRLDEIVIALPLGGYIPTFVHRKAVHRLAAFAARMHWLIPQVVYRRLGLVALVACMVAAASVAFNVAIVSARWDAPGACTRATASESVEPGDNDPPAYSASVI